MSNKIIIELQSKDNATGQIIASVKTLEGNLGGLEKTGISAFAGLDTAVSGSLASLGKFAVAIGAASAALAGMAFRKGIEAIDEFEQKTIGIAAQLTNMAAAGQGSFKEMFDRNLGHAKMMYEELRKIDADRFASLEDMMSTYNILVQKGYAARVEEAKYIGIITDKIKMATQGQEASVQINQEIRALMDGQARAGSQIAQELQNRLGPGWSDIVEKHKQAGDLLQWLSGLWPGIEAATAHTQETLEAQKTTLQGNLKYVGREGLAGAYDDIVGLAKRINEYLRGHGDELAERISAAWKQISASIKNVYDTLSLIPSLGLQEYFQKSLGELRLFTAELKAAAQLIRLDFSGFMETRRQYKFDHLQVGKSLIGYGTEGGGHITAAEAAGQTKSHSFKDRYANMDKEFMERFNAMAAAYKEATGKELEITDAFRTFAQQAELYKRKPGLAARPGTSMHEKGLAMDINPAQANELSAMGFLDIYGFHRPMLGQGASGKNEPWHIEMVNYKAQEKDRVDAIKEAEKALRDYEKHQERVLRLESKFSREGAKEAAKGAEEAKKMVESVMGDLAKYAENRHRLDVEARDWTVSALRDAMQNENLSYDQRLALGEQYKDKRIEQINAEIEALRKTYGGRVSEDTLASYQEAMVDQVDRQIKNMGDTGSFAWEAAWKRAAENVQDALGDTIYSLMTQTKTAGDVLANIANGLMRIISQMAAEAIINVARTAMQSANIVGGGSGFSSIFSGIGNFFSNIFSGRSLSAIGPYTPISQLSSLPSITAYHEGGTIRPVYAHRGLNLAADEVPIIAQTGERVLSRSENRAYERGVEFSITVVNNTGTPVKATGQRTSDKEFMLILDQMNASLIHSGGATTKALEQRFSLSQSIVRR